MALDFGSSDQGFIGGVESLPSDFYDPFPQNSGGFIGGGSGALPNDEYAGIGGSLKSFVNGNAIKSNAGDGIYNNQQPVFRIPSINFMLGGGQAQNPGSGNSNLLLIGLAVVGIIVLLMASKK